MDKLYMGPIDATGTLCGFFLLHVPVKGKIAPTFFPIGYFVKQKEEEDEG